MINVGIDCEDINRFKIENIDKYEKKFLSKQECEYYMEFSDEKKLKFIAARFSCKEAIFKAIGIGIDKVKFKDISILNDDNGKPICLIEGYECSVSITYCNNIVTTIAYIEGV